MWGAAGYIELRQRPTLTWSSPTGGNQWADTILLKGGSGGRTRTREIPSAILAGAMSSSTLAITGK